MNHHSILPLFFLLLFTFSCSKSPILPEQRLRINIQSEPNTLDPRKAQDLNAITILHMLFEGLTRIGKTGSVELALADEITVSEDQLHYQIHLRDALWSNGKPISSYDFANSWKRTLSPHFPSNIAYQLYPIKGSEAMKNGIDDEWGVQTPDNRTLLITLKTALPYFLELLSTPAFFPVFGDPSDDLWSRTPTSLICNGPFTMSQWNHADRIELVRNPHYWHPDEVKIQHLDLFMVSEETELRLFEQQELDWAGSPLSSLPPDAIKTLKEQNAMNSHPLLGTYFLRINTEDPMLNNLSLRKAFALAINRTAIVEHILQGGQQIATTLVPPCLGLSSRGITENTPHPFSSCCKTLQLLYQHNERNHLIAQALQQQIKERLGITIQLEAVERKTLFERVSRGTYQLAAGSWIADYNDPVNFLEVFAFKSNSANNTGWEDPKYVDWLSRSALCTSKEERTLLLRQAEELLMEQVPIIPLFHYALTYLQNPSLEDVALSAIGQVDFRWAHKNEQKSF